MSVDAIILLTTPAIPVAGYAYRRTSTASYVRTNRFAAPEQTAGASFSQVRKSALEQLDRAPTPASESYVVQSGETLSGLVRKRLEMSGSTPSAQEIQQGVAEVVRKNQLTNPDLIYPGQKIDVTPLGNTPAASVSPPLESSVRTLQAESAARSQLETAPASETAEGGESATKVSTLPEQDTTSGSNLADVVYEILHGSVAPSAKTLAAANTSEDAPVWTGLLAGEARVSSSYGMRRDPFSGRRAFHHGLDLAAAKGTDIHPAASGTVTFAGWKPGYGRMVSVRHEDGTETIYGHANSTSVRKGQSVTEDTVLAHVGSTGRSTGPHLHFEVRRNGHSQDPMAYLEQGVLQLARSE